MVFSSLLFLFRFLPVMLIAYFAAPKRLRNGVLFIGSLIFYGWGEPVYIVLLLFSTVVDFVHGRMIGKARKNGKEQAAKWLVVSSAVINLSLLGFFKYAGFLAGVLYGISGLKISVPELALPIGISFYTFQTMSYTIDVYRGQARVQDDIIAFGAYVSMFPQLIAGPIVRYHTIAEELRQRSVDYGKFAVGIRYFVIGLGKKVLLANNIGALWNEIQSVPVSEKTIVMVWLGIFAFGMQIYFDFSGYSDMAIGLGYMMGFHFPGNFHYPYMAKSITDFWRRWHITLGTWFKEYVYIPLGGNRKGKAKQVRNILVVWLLTGIWHGAGWNYVLWGLYFGLLLLVEKLFLGPYLKRLPGFFQRIYAVFFVFIGWVLFVHEDMTAMILYFRQMFGMGELAFCRERTLYLLVTSLPLAVIAILAATDYPRKWCEGSRLCQSVRLGKEWIVWMFLFLIITAYLVDASYNPFLYFRF